MSSKLTYQHAFSGDVEVDMTPTGIYSHWERHKKIAQNILQIASSPVPTNNGRWRRQMASRRVHALTDIDACVDMYCK
jgi:hypothetical protein